MDSITNAARGVARRSEPQALRQMLMKIAIIGTGSMGTTLARHFGRCGHDVVIANSRGAESLTALATDLGVAPVCAGEAGNGADVVVLAIPTKAVVHLPRTLFAGLSLRSIVIDPGNYHPELRDGRIEAIERGMLDSQWVAQQIGRPVIKAFNNILAGSLLENARPPGTPGRIALPVAGDSRTARAAVCALVEEIGFDSADGGALADSWRQGTGTPAYCKDLDAAGLQRALAAADHRRIAEYRAEREAEIARNVAARRA
jgi:8-hydroxy-5-deazaflavin:NADPH oxidoreductase